MEIELYNCPHCFAKGVIKTKDNLCPSCKQILSEENKQNSEIPEAENITENKSLIEQSTLVENSVLSRFPRGKFTGAIIFLGIILAYILPIVLFLKEVSFIIYNPGRGAILLYLLIFTGSLIIIVGLILSKVTATIKIIFSIGIFLFMIPYFIFLLIMSLRPWDWGP